ncbi:MAG TPA: FAD-dependent oxidoreductase [Gemmatimonadaceae bacterium]|nr:FAD-dependent oxidoreductase [Gemmatimonadaceae bacterium]
MAAERVVVVGGGLIGLATAAALEQRGVAVTLIAERRDGEASTAAAGMLAPGVEAAAGPAHDFGIAARDRYPAFLDWLQRATGVTVPSGRDGILQLPATPADVSRLRQLAQGDAVWLTVHDLRTLEPAIEAGLGALLHQKDGWVDNAALVGALRAYAAGAAGIDCVDDRAVAIEPSADGAAVRCASGRHHTGSSVIVATGAWTRDLAGLPRSLPVLPVRGQMLSLSASPIRHVAFGGGGYAVPRPGGETYIGSTMEHVGFDASTTPKAHDQLRKVAAAIAPALAGAPLLRHWAGLRPLTPDMQPVVGRDPDMPSVIYACGHSRNGILMAPLTADVVSALACGEQPWYDLSPFSPTRFKN